MNKTDYKCVTVEEAFALIARLAPAPAGHHWSAVYWAGVWTVCVMPHAAPGF